MGWAAGKMRWFDVAAVTGGRNLQKGLKGWQGTGRVCSPIGYSRVHAMVLLGTPSELNKNCKVPNSTGGDVTIDNFGSLIQV